MAPWNVETRVQSWREQSERPGAVTLLNALVFSAIV